MLLQNALLPNISPQTRTDCHLLFYASPIYIMIVLWRTEAVKFKLLNKTQKDKKPRFWTSAVPGKRGGGLERVFETSDI